MRGVLKEFYMEMVVLRSLGELSSRGKVAPYIYIYILYINIYIYI